MLEFAGHCEPARLKMLFVHHQAENAYNRAVKTALPFVQRNRHWDLEEDHHMRGSANMIPTLCMSLSPTRHKRESNCLENCLFPENILVNIIFGSDSADRQVDI